MISAVRNPLPGTGEGETFTNRGFLLSVKYLLQKENLCPVFRAFQTFTGSQSPLDQNNPYIQEAFWAVKSPEGNHATCNPQCSWTNRGRAPNQKLSNTLRVPLRPKPKVKFHTNASRPILLPFILHSPTGLILG